MWVPPVTPPDTWQNLRRSHMAMQSAARHLCRAAVFSRSVGSGSRGIGAAAKAQGEDAAAFVPSRKSVILIYSSVGRRTRTCSISLNALAVIAGPWRPPRPTSTHPDFCEALRSLRPLWTSFVVVRGLVGNQADHTLSRYSMAIIHASCRCRTAVGRSRPNRRTIARSRRSRDAAVRQPVRYTCTRIDLTTGFRPGFLGTSMGAVSPGWAWARK